MSYFNTIYAASPGELPHRARAVNTIADDLQLSRSTVKRALHDLIEAGLIEKESRYRENGSRTSNRLILKKQ